MITTVTKEAGAVDSIVEISPYTAGNDPYLLAPLDLSSESIRLVEILPTRDPDTIRCRLRSYAISSDCPEYVAISYMWDHNTHASIELNDTTFALGKNLWWFLYRMQLRGEFGPFWIDAICINQSSTLEKNHQVPLMRQIYSGAQSVSIWLGEHVKGTYSWMALSHLKRLQRAGYVYNGPDLWPMESNRLKIALWILSQHQYWTRVWIIQEVLLAASANICSGNVKVDLAVLDDVFHFIQGRGGLDDDWLAETPCNKVMAFFRVMDHEPLSILLNFFKDHQATILVDKVYALIGLARERTFIEVDYSKAPRELFENVAVLLWCSQRCDRWPQKKVYESKETYEAITAALARELMLDYDSEEVTRLVSRHCALESCALRKH